MRRGPAGRRGLRWRCSTNRPGAGLRPAALVAEADYGANADFRHGLEDRSLPYALQLKGEMTAQPESALPHQQPYNGRGPRPLPRYRIDPLGLGCPVQR